MRLNQSFVVQHPRALVWDYFGRIAEVSQCMPGASVTVAEGGGPVGFTLAVKLGPISTAFAGSCEVERDDTLFRGVIRGGGQDRRSNSRTKGEIEYRLLEQQGGRATRVDIAVDYSLAGSLAQFSRESIVNDIAARLTTEFATNLQARLDATSSSQAKPAAAQQLDAGSLIFPVIWARIKAFLAGLCRRR
jgi:aerobic carbon-monoxide dehydrogenase small subunit